MWIQTQSTVRKYQSLNVHGWYQTVCQKLKKELETLKQAVRIHIKSGYQDRI